METYTHPAIGLAPARDLVQEGRVGAGLRWDLAPRVGFETTAYGLTVPDEEE